MSRQKSKVWTTLSAQIFSRPRKGLSALGRLARLGDSFRRLRDEFHSRVFVGENAPLHARRMGLAQEFGGLAA